MTPSLYDDNGTAYTYMENVVLNKKLTLTAANKGMVTVQADNSYLPVFTINSYGNGSIIQNFIITGSTGNSGIYIENSEGNTISDNVLSDNNYGILLDDSISNTISDNNGTGNQYGIYVYQSSNNTIIKNNFSNSDGYGIVLDYSESNNITGNNLKSNYYGGIWLQNSQYNIINENTAASNDNGICLDYSDNNKIYDNNLTSNWDGMEVHYSDDNIITRNTITDNWGTEIIFYYSTANINFNSIFGNGLQYGGYGLYSEGYETINATNNWWGSDEPLESVDGPTDICIIGTTADYYPWFESDIAFTLEDIKTTAETLKTYIETNHQLPCCINISGISINMAQFLKLSSQAILDINSELNSTIILGGFQNAPNPTENMTNGLILDSEFVDIANNIKIFMNDNEYAPNYMTNISLGDSIRFESLVYMYSQILNSYNSTEGILPGSVSVIPWIAVSNPGKVYNFRTQEFFNTIQAVINDADTQNNDTISIGDGTFTENVDVNKILTICSLSGNSTVNAANTGQPVFSIGSNGSGSTLLALIIKGSTGSSGVYIISNNNTVLGNNITSNLNGIYLANSTYSGISGNVITNSTANGILINSCTNSTISDNTIKFNSQNGIKIQESSNIDISSNIISNNADGIYLENSSVDIKFNIITGNID